MTSFFTELWPSVCNFLAINGRAVAVQAELQLVLERCLRLTCVQTSVLCSTCLETIFTHIVKFWHSGLCLRVHQGSSTCQGLIKISESVYPCTTLPPNAHFLHLKMFANYSTLPIEAIPANFSENWFPLFSIPRVLNFYIMHLSHTIYFLVPLSITLASSILSTLPFFWVHSHLWIFPVNNNSENNSSHLLTA